MAVCLDILRLPGTDKWTSMLSVGSNSKVVVIELTEQGVSEVASIDGLTDNVSCLKTVYMGD